MRIVGSEQKKEEEEKLNSSDSDAADGMVFPSQSVRRCLFAAYENDDSGNEKKKKKMSLNEIVQDLEDFEELEH